MKKLSGEKFVEVYSEHIGRYVTRIWTNDRKVIHQNDGLHLDDEGKSILLKLKYEGYQLPEDNSHEFYL